MTGHVSNPLVSDSASGTQSALRALNRALLANSSSGGSLSLAAMDRMTKPAARRRRHPSNGHPQPAAASHQRRRRYRRSRLADIFPPRDLSPLKLDPSRVRTLIATGDVIPARYTDVIIRQRGDDFLYPVAATKDITSAADLTVINLEAPLIEACPYHDAGLVFCGRPGIIGPFRRPALML